VNEDTPTPLGLEGLADRLEAVAWKYDHRGFMARCPAHDDRTPSLAVDVGEDKPVVIHCHAGCSPEDVLDALGLRWSDFEPARTLRPLTPTPSPVLGTGWTADVLAATVLPEQRWAVPGLLPAGLVVLAGAPKVGKSWLLLDLCLRVAMGRPVLGTCEVEAGPTLYLALEDTPRRLQSRMGMLLRDDEKAPATAHLHTSWPRMGEGGADLLRQHMTDHPDTRVVAVDVLSRIRDLAKSDGGMYDADYEAMHAFKKIADDFDVLVLVNHHDRKAKAEDWMTTVSGTRGVTGAADAILLLTKPRGAADGLLSITGRDVEEAQHALKFSGGQWTLLDQPARTYSLSDTRARILRLLLDHPGLRPAEVADRLDGVSRDNAKQTLARMREDQQVSADATGRYRAAGDIGKGVTPVTLSPDQPASGDTSDRGVEIRDRVSAGQTDNGDSGDRSDSSSRVTDLAQPLTTIDHSDDLAGLSDSPGNVLSRFRVGLDSFDPADTHDDLAWLAEPCPEIPPGSALDSPEFDVVPTAKTITETGWLARYVCPWCGYGWTTHHADLEGISA
jgi:hypothetical protein